jgi:hypothetical protein
LLTTTYPFVLRFTPGQPRVFLRNLCGHDELAVGDVGTMGAVQLLNRLLVDVYGTRAGGLTAEQLVVADRDRLLALVYRYTYGPGIESTVICQSCNVRFDLDFSLDDLLAHQEAEPVTESAEWMENGTLFRINEARFRLPTGEDELAAWGLPARQVEQSLLRRCIREGDPATDGAAVQQAMERIAPLLQVELLAHCPECGKDQALQFDVQSFLLSRLINDQKRVAGEVHRIARAYGWSSGEILNLPRKLRRTYVALIEADRDTF